MRNPPGYGSIVNLGKNRRRPIAVRVPNGTKFNKNGIEIQAYKYLDYFPNTKEGKIAANTLLARYNSGIEVRTSPNIAYCPTFAEMAEAWLPRHLLSVKRKNQGKEASQQLISSYKAALKKCHSINHKKINMVKFQDVQDIADSVMDMSLSSVTNVKIVLNGVFDYSRKQGHIEKNFIEDVEFSYRIPENQKHLKFSDDEVNLLWKNTGDYNVRIILIMIYTGLRIEELLIQKNKNVFLPEQYMVGGVKTGAGIDRLIPIADKIRPFIEELYGESTYLLQNGSKRYERYSFITNIWNPVMEKLGLSHMPHDTRYTCASLMDKMGVNDNCKKLILGHARPDITNGVYVQKDISDLLEAINKI